MARCSFARWRPLPEAESQPRIDPTQYLLHSAVDAPGPTDLGRYFARADVTLESHFWIWLDGTIDQFVDTERSADANYRANRRPDGTGAISVETEDEGNPDQRPWTPAQVTSIVRLGAWARDTHAIPAVRCPSPSSPGLGYHSMFGAPSDWTPARGKTCPGGIRITQIPSIFEAIRHYGTNPERPEEDSTMPDGTIIRRKTDGRVEVINDFQRRHMTPGQFSFAKFVGRTVSDVESAEFDMLTQGLEQIS